MLSLDALMVDEQGRDALKGSLTSRCVTGSNPKLRILTTGLRIMRIVFLLTYAGAPEAAPRSSDDPSAAREAMTVSPGDRSGP